MMTGFVCVLGTPQIPDRLIHKGDTLAAFLHLPNEFYKTDTLAVDLFGGKEACLTTACWRGYQAEWRIEEDQLYLIGIYSCCYRKDGIKADLSQLFKNKFKEGKVKADWVTEKVLSDRGKTIAYFQELHITEQNIEFEFVNGKLVNTVTYDNSKSRRSAYSQDAVKLKEFIYSNIDWDRIPLKKETVKVLLRYSANEEGKVDDVKVLRGSEDEFSQEAIRVVKLIPDWDVFYRKGKLVRIPWSVKVIFNEENRLKYKKQY